MLCSFGVIDAAHSLLYCLTCPSEGGWLVGDSTISFDVKEISFLGNSGS